jgi:hypothetical protein
MVREINYENLVDNLAREIVRKLEKKGLVSLYLSGTILTKDRVKTSDIDFFGFVKNDFDIVKEEKSLNNFLDKNKKKLCKGIECRFRAIGIDELDGKKSRGVLSKHVGLENLALTFPYWNLIWGKKINYKIKPYNLKRRKIISIEKIESIIKDIDKREKYLQNISKEVIRLAEIESEILFNKKYTYYYIDTQKRFIDNKSHVVHEAMRLRKKKVTKKDIDLFIPKIKDYLIYMKSIK